MDRIFCTIPFSRWMSKNGADNEALLRAVEEMESGLIDADLGGCLYKKRIPLSGQGKRKSSRVLVAMKYEEKCFFLYGFNKNERSNISKKELRALQTLGKELLALTEESLSSALRKNKLKEVLP